jgi:YaiO family outer membrane protein
VAFRSQVVSAKWREPVTPTAGVSIEMEHYRNPAYQRTGVSLGVFMGTNRW